MTMPASESDSGISKETRVLCICTKRCGGPSKGRKLVSLRSRQRHVRNEHKQPPTSFLALRGQSPDAPPATGVTASRMESGTNKRRCLDPAEQHHMASGSLNEDSGRGGDDIVCCVSWTRTASNNI